MICTVRGDHIEKKETGGHVARTGERSGVYRDWTGWGNLTERDHLADEGVDGRIILKWMFRKLGVGHRKDRDR